MNKETWTAVDDYAADLFIGEDPVLDAALADSEATGLPPINVSPAQGSLLKLLAKSVGARRILEIGTLGGYSTIWLARALPEDGRLVTLEHAPKHATVARTNIERAGLKDVVEIIVGPAPATLPRLVEDREQFDVVFIDADKASYPDYLNWSLQLTRPGSLIIADNVVRRGRVIEADSPDPHVQGVRRFSEMAAADPRLEAVLLQTVGSKGYDGLALLLVR